jgi:RNA polymerase-binding transcription factor DksA
MTRDEALRLLQRQVTRKIRQSDGTPAGEDVEPWKARNFDEAMVALQRKQKGLYGLCIECMGEIPLERLKVKPEAVRCVACQQTYERRAASGT